VSPLEPFKTLPFSRWTAIVILLGLSVIFASNHIAARFAFDNGANVVSAVLIRSIGTAAAMFGLIQLAKLSWRLPGLTFRRAIIIGVLVAAQSFCLYSAVAKIPVALALLVFNLFSLCYTLLNWAISKVRPSNTTLAIFPIVLLGLALALNPLGWGAAQAPSAIEKSKLYLGVSFAFAAAFLFGLVLTFTERWMGKVDGRLRTFISMIVVGFLALIVVIFGQAQFPYNAIGWAGLLGLTLAYGTAFSCLFTLMPRLNMPANSAVMNFEPIASLLLAWSLLGQKLLPIQVLGALLVVGAIVAIGLVNRK
jgi:drug/metabolite transporter (DMT)-like permease